MSQDFGHKASRAQLEKVAHNMNERGFATQIASTKEEALKILTKLIPEGAEVMTGSSTTLNEIGFSDLLQKGMKDWVNVSAKVWSENDDAKRMDLRRKATTSEYFLSSVNAVTKEGQLVAVDASGSRVGALPFAAKNIIFVIGAQKLTSDLESAMQRIREYVFPKEDVRAQEAYGFGSALNKWVIIEREVPGRIQVILVEDSLGF